MKKIIGIFILIILVSSVIPATSSIVVEKTRLSNITKIQNQEASKKGILGDYSRNNCKMMAFFDNSCPIVNYRPLLHTIYVKFNGHMTLFTFALLGGGYQQFEAFNGGSLNAIGLIGAVVNLDQGSDPDGGSIGGIFGGSARCLYVTVHPY